MNSQFFSEQFLNGLPSNTDDAIIKVCNEYLKMCQKLSDTTHHNDDYIEASAIILAFFNSKEFGISDWESNYYALQNILKSEKESAEKRIFDRNETRHKQIQKEKYDVFFSKRNDNNYKFSDDEYEKIQVLINQLREDIKSAKKIPQNHKERLLKRLEAMQKELHKTLSNFDQFLGFWLEIGIAGRKFGEDMEPITTRFGKIIVIVATVIETKEKLPALENLSKLLLPQ